jgi:hypothetical protein
METNRMSGRYLAHSKGSKDKRPHITALLRGKDGSTITNAHGNLVHVYYDVSSVPAAYTPS